MLTKIKYFIISTLFIITTTATAEELSGEFIGDISDASPSIISTGATSVKVSFTYDTSAEFAYSNTYGLGWYNDILVRIHYEFFNAQGEIIDLGFMGPFELNEVNGGEAPGGFLVNYVYNFISYEINQELYYAYFNLDVIGGTAENLYRPEADFPTFISFKNQPVSLKSTLIINTPSLTNTAYINLDVHTLRYLGTDSDDDGVIDEDDICPTSLPHETVLFGDWLDSSVANHTDEQGCTIMDHYAACHAENNSSYSLGYSGPSYCEQKVGYTLMRKEIISYTELRLLRTALSMSYRNSN